MQKIYLDHNATSPTDPNVWSAIHNAVETFGNPSSKEHSFGWDAAQAVTIAREHIASLLHARAHEIIFTSTATESINLAIRGVRAETILSSAADHEAVLAVGRQLEESRQARFVQLPVDDVGRTRPESLDEALSTQRGPTLVALIHANNEVGTLNHIEHLSHITHSYGAKLFIDSTQAVGRIPVDLSASGVDLASFSAHKMHGPKGVGALYIRGGPERAALEPLIVGGSQERGLRAGTLNVLGIIGFGEACRLAGDQPDAERKRILSLRNLLEDELRRELDDVSINGDVEKRLPNTTNLCFSGIDARKLLIEACDVAASTKSACSSGNPGPSHVLKAIGLSDEDAYASIRFSLGRFTTRDEIELSVEHIVKAVKKLRAIKHR